MTPHRRNFLASLAPLMFLVSCASPNPVLYTLAPVQGAAAPGAPATVILHAPALARYLERPEIVRGSSDYRVQVLSNDWWGEPIGSMIGRVLAADLTQRLPGTTVLTDRGAIVAPPTDAAVEMNILRFDANAAGAVVLDAQAAVNFTGARKAARVRTFRFVEREPSSDVTGQVAAMSRALGAFADGVAAMLRRG